MQLLEVSLISLITLIATALWVWRQGRQQSRIAYAIYGLIIFEALSAVLGFIGVELNSWFLVGGQIIAWSVLLRGIAVEWRFIAIGIVVSVVVQFLSFPADSLLGWGFITAVPLAAVSVLRQLRHFPIIAPSSTMPRLRPVSSTKGMTAEMVNSQQPILECLVTGILICGQSGLILSTNQAATAILGIAEDDMVGQPVTDILKHFPILGTPDESSQSRRFEMNGRTVQGYLNLIYDKEGRVQGTVVILDDVTAEYQASRARDNFLTTVSHELRTPMTAIKGYVELLKGGTGGTLNETQRAFTNIIERNATRMVHLINSLIFASSIKGGRLEYISGYADLPQIIQQISREMSPLASENQQTIKTDIDSRLRQIEVDPIHLATIVEELIANSIKYNHPGGEIRIAALLESETFAVVSVSDDGIGIDTADQMHIFDDFYRPDLRDTQVRAGGIGMGLSIVRALVEAYNGRIWFESVPDQGSTFTFILPTQQPENQTPLTRPEITFST